MDLHQQLTALAGPEVATTPAAADADLHRGRRALRRRRAAQTLTGSACAVAAVAVAVAVAVFAGGTPVTTTPNASGGTAVVTATRLVAYTGSQPKGYTIDKVPDGWEIQADNAHTLIMAPKDSINKDPNSYVGKIGIFLQSKDDSHTPEGKKVKLGDVDAVLVKEKPLDPLTARLHAEAKAEAIAKGGPSAAPFLAESDAGDGATLWVKQPGGRYLQIQFSAGLGLSEQDKLDIGAGVHVHEEALQLGG